MPWLSDWTFWQEWEVDRPTFTFSTRAASVWHRINSQSLNKLSLRQTQRIIKPHTVQADSSCKRLKRQATVFIKNNGGKKTSISVAVSVTPSESPLGHLTCKGNEYFVDWFVPSHIEPSFLKSTLVTLDLSCMEVRALGPAEVDWADNSKRMLSGKVTPRQLSFHTPCLSDPWRKMQDFSLKILFVHLMKFRRKKKQFMNLFPCIPGF